MFIYVFICFLVSVHVMFVYAIFFFFTFILVLSLKWILFIYLNILGQYSHVNRVVLFDFVFLV